METSQAIIGCLLGTAVGDSLGLPFEGLSRRRQKRLFGTVTSHRLLWGGRGMVSDDTEHTDLTARALLVSGGNPERFTRALAKGLKRWFLLLPAGVGWATLRACLRLLIGIPPDHSGVVSAGNGPAMRAALLGVCWGDNRECLRTFVRASARLTHTDPRAENGALLVAVAAHLSAQGELTGNTLQAWWDQSGIADAALHDLLAAVAESVARGEATPAFAARQGWGERVSGYVYQTVPVALHAVLTYPRDLKSAVLAAIACGGDTDTTGAIVGGIVGAGVGEAGIPAEWLAGMVERPRSVAYLRAMGTVLAQSQTKGRSLPAPSLPLSFLAARNLFFTTVVLAHGLRRLLPPY